MEARDVVIVGGGPAGSSCAWALRHSGLDVLVLDRATFPRNKLCAGWITPLILDELGFTVGEYAAGRTIQPITGFRLNAIGQPQVEVDCGQVVSYGIRRCEFDEFLLRRSGAEVREGFQLSSLERTSAGWVINGSLSARMLVGAGGHFCPVGRYLGNKASPAPVLAQEVEFELSSSAVTYCTTSGEVPELFFCPDLLGYGWVFRKGSYLNVGLGRTDSHEISRHVLDFVSYLATERGIETPTAGLAGHAYGLWGRSRRKFLDDAVLLIGDAAGLAYPESGEGIRPAIESGLMAAHAIVSADGDYSRQKLQPYAELLHERLSREHSRLEFLTRLLPASLKQFAGRRLLRNRDFCRNVVVNRWFLRAAEQRLRLTPEPIPQSR